LVPIETDPEIRLENQRRITFSWGKVLGQLFIMFALYCGKIMEMVRETENTTKTGKAMIYTVATVIVGTVALVFLTMQIVMLFLDKDTEERRYDRIAEFPSSRNWAVTRSRRDGAKKVSRLCCAFTREKAASCGI